MESTAQVRKEIKFLIPQTELHQIECWLHLNTVCLRTHYPDRWINSIYFDTEDLSAFRDNLAGVSVRTKVRYRWYGENECIKPGYLEIKKRKNNFGWKLRFQTPLEFESNEVTWEKFLDYLKLKVPEEGRQWLDRYSIPILINRYSRQYFVSSSGNLRVTVDRNQSVWGQVGRLQPNLELSSYVYPSAVVEVKYGIDDSVEALCFLDSVPMRMCRHSKYVNGVRAIIGL